MNNQLLKGIRVLDLTGTICGQFCTSHLADHGAEVIRITGAIDACKDTDLNSETPQAADEISANLNKNKTHVSLDVETEAGRTCFQRLASSSDVIAVGFHFDGSPPDYGLHYPTMAAENPRLVYATFNGAGHAQPGTASDNSDAFAGMSMAFSIVAALREAEATGKGRHLASADCDPITHLQGNTGHTKRETPATNAVMTADDFLRTRPDTSTTDPDARRNLRNAFGAFATGVTVVTTRQPDGTPRGFTANSFTSVSLDPPMLLVCIAKAAHSCDTFAQTDHFAVNILADDQKDVSGLFASQTADKFALADWHSDAQNMPLIHGALASFSCASHRLVDAGDHLILIGEVLNFETAEGAPLGYYKGAYFDLGLEEKLADAAASATAVSLGAVLASGHQILLHEDASGHIRVPVAPAKTNSVSGLSDYLAGLGLTPALEHLYAIYQNAQSGAQRIICHGSVTGRAPAGMRYFDLCTLPLDLVPDRAERSMLRRYCAENRHGAFGIYHGTETEGVVHAVAGRRKYQI